MGCKETGFFLFFLVASFGCRGGGFFLDPEEADKELGLPGSSETGFGSQVAYEHASRGEILASRGDWDGAIDELKTALGSDPKDPYIKTRLAESYLEIDKFDLAKRQIEEILKWDQNSELGWLALAKYHKALGEKEKAKKAARRAIRVEPSLIYGALWLAEFHSEHGEHEEAAEVLSRLVLAQPNKAEPRLKFAETLLALGKGFEAKEHLELFVRLRPFRADVLEKMATLSLEDGDKLGALELLEIALGKDPANKELRMKVIRLSLGLDLKRKAKRHLDSLPQLPKGEVESGIERACLLARAGEAYRARALLVDQFGAKPKEPMVALALADIEVRLGRLETAELLVEGADDKWSSSGLSSKDALLRGIRSWPDGTEPCGFLKE